MPSSPCTGRLVSPSRILCTSTSVLYPRNLPFSLQFKRWRPWCWQAWRYLTTVSLHPSPILSCISRHTERCVKLTDVLGHFCHLNRIWVGHTGICRWKSGLYDRRCWRCRKWRNSVIRQEPSFIQATVLACYSNVQHENAKNVNVQFEHGTRSTY